MASKKAKRYGQGGSGHKQIRSNRPGGKAYKLFAKAFSASKRRLVTVPHALAGTKVD